MGTFIYLKLRFRKYKVLLHLRPDIHIREDEDEDEDEDSLEYFSPTFSQRRNEIQR